MEDKKTIREKINGWFSANGIEAEVVDKVEVVGATEVVADEKKFEDLSLNDGVTILTAEPALEPGNPVALTANDETIPAPIGEYELEDGRIVVVMEDGIIAEIKEPVVEGEEEPAAQVEEPMKEEPKSNDKIKRLIERIEKEQIFEKFAESITKNEALESKYADLENKYNTLAERSESFETLVKESFEALLDEPNKKPVVKQTMPFAKEKKKNIFKPQF